MRFAECLTEGLPKMRENPGGVKVGVVWMSAIVLAVGLLFTSIAGRAQTPQAGAILANPASPMK